VNALSAKLSTLLALTSLCVPSPALAAPSPFGPQPQPGATPAKPVPAPTAPEMAPTDAAVVTASDVKDSISLPEVFDILKRRSPRYKAVQYEVEVAKSEGKAARVLPNPVLNLAILYLNQGFNQNGVATYYANVTLPLLIAGQRRMRVKTAEIGVRSAEANVKANYHSLAHEARARFVELQAAQARVAVLDEALAEFARLQNLVVERKRSGAETEYDALRVAMEISSWKARRAEEQAAAEDIAGHLGVLLGVPSWYPRAQGELREIGITGDPDHMWPEIERTQPGIEAARREEAHAVKGVDLAKRERWPVPSITAGTVAIQNYYSISTTVGLTVPIPVFDWGQGLMARANARSQQSRLHKDAVIAETRAEFKRALRMLEHRRKAVQIFEQDVYSKLPTLQQAAEDSFRIGQMPLVDLLEATGARFEVKLTHVDIREAAVQAEVDVLAVTGRIEELRPR
jgi:cobalt-zinc-cadmium efflux system outer membrane protein